MYFLSVSSILEAIFELRLLLQLGLSQLAATLMLMREELVSCLFYLNCVLNAEFTPGKTKGIDYIFNGEVRRLKKTVTPPSSTEAPNSKHGMFE